MKIILNNSSMVPIYEQLMNQIKNEIIEGTLASGTALPSVRALSGELKISALTVKKAYDYLEEDGFVVTVHGKGSFVAETNRNLAFEACRKTVEDEFAKVILKAKNFGLSNEELSTISFDDSDNCMAFLFTLPCTRKQYVLEKYIFVYGVSMLAGYFKVAQLWIEEKNRKSPEEMAVIMRRIVQREP